MRRPSAQPTSRPTRWRCGPPASPTLSRPRCSRPRWFAPRAPRRSAIPFSAGTSSASGLALALIAGTLLFAVLAAGARPLADRFFDAGAVGLAASGLAAGLLLLLGVMEFVGAPSAVAAGLLRGRKVTRAPMLFALIGHWGVGAPIGLYLCEAMGHGITGLWIGLTAGTLFTSVLTVHHLFARQGPASARTPLLSFGGRA